MRLGTRQQRLIAWLASVVMAMAALWPSLSLALTAQSGPNQALLTLCSPGRIAKGQAVSKGGSLLKAGESGPGMAAPNIAPGACWPQSPLAPPPGPVQWAPALNLAPQPPPALADAHALPKADGWPNAIPRAPPFHAP